MSRFARLPPFETVIKSREVEDPINLWVHRPLAYAFVALVYRTSITPNQITALALVVGFAAAGCWFVGTPALMVIGGCLLWTSAILDGADGILARAKQMFSDTGRALDGFADMMVALATVAAAFYHVWAQWHNPMHLWLMPIALLMSVVHVYSYDYYKEAYLQHTNPGWDGAAERVSDVQARVDRAVAERAPWPVILATRSHVDLLGAQQKVVQLTNPAAMRAHLQFPVSSESVAIYRKYNAAPMQLWAAISLAPHSYGMSICAMFDRLDVYLLLRAVVANVLFAIALLWQRRATRKTREALSLAGLEPMPAPAAGAHVADATS
jgi:phosphatidylglycerophosphate synthase